MVLAASKFSHRSVTAYAQSRPTQLCIIYLLLSLIDAQVIYHYAVWEVYNKIAHTCKVVALRDTVKMQEETQNVNSDHQISQQITTLGLEHFRNMMEDRQTK